MTDQENILSHKKPETSATDYDQLRGLINACISQDRVAQKELYVKYSPILFGMIRRYIYDVNIGQEILSDVFLKVYTKLHLYSFQGAFEGWLRRIVVNTITDHLRKNIKHKQTLSTDTTSDYIYVTDDAVDKLTYKELLIIVHGLPEMQRAVFNLFVFESLSHKEISQNLGITENNSRWHLNDARRRLKEKIKLIM